MSEQETTNNPRRGTVHRSPAFPAISLKSAIERARAFYQHERRASASVSVVAGHWGYSPTSSGGKQILAALIAYGLMEDEGSGENRHVRLTDLAFRILLDERLDSKEREEAIRRAAFMPKINVELFGRWPDGLPSNPNLRHYLLVEKKFNENSVDDFIRQLRATAEYANIYAEPIIEHEPTLDSTQESQQYGVDIAPSESPRPNVAPPIIQPPLQKSQARQDTFSLDEGLVVLQWPGQLSKESYEDLSDWLELQLRKIKRSVQSPEGNEP